MSLFFLNAAQAARRDAEGMVCVLRKRLAQIEQLPNTLLNTMFAHERQRAFTRFLAAWQGGETEAANAQRNDLPEGSREHWAASFLLDPRPLATKEAAFRSDGGKTKLRILQFAIGEHHLKQREYAAAVEAYSISRQREGMSTGTPSLTIELLLRARHEALLDVILDADEPPVPWRTLLEPLASP